MAYFVIPAAEFPNFSATGPQGVVGYTVRRRELDGGTPRNWVDLGFFIGSTWPNIGASQGDTEFEVRGYWLDRGGESDRWLPCQELKEHIDIGRQYRFVSEDNGQAMLVVTIKP